MVTTFDQQPPPSAPPTSGGSGSTGGQESHLDVEIEHQVKGLINDAKEEGVPIVGHPLEGLDNTGDGGGQGADPFAQLFTAGFGWMIDSVSFLREPIEKLDGDASAVQTIVDSMKTVTENLTYVAHAHREDIPTLADWQGAAAEAHRDSMKLLHEEIRSLARVVEGLGSLTAVSGAMVITLRKIVRDLVATAIGSIVIIMLAAMAAAFWTLGASVGVGIAASIAAAVTVLVESGRRITMLMDALGRQTDRMGELETIAEDIADALKRFEKATDFPTSGGSDPTNQSGSNAPNTSRDEVKPRDEDKDEETEKDDDTDEEDSTDGGPKGLVGAVKNPDQDQKEKGPEYWDKLWEKADAKVEEFDKEVMRHMFGDHGKMEEALKLKEQWAGIRDDANTKWEEATRKAELQELGQAKEDLGD